MKARETFCIALILAGLLGCQPLEPHAPSTPATNNMVAPLDPGTPNSSAQALIERARAQLARKFGLDEAAIFLVSARPVEWPDASLGCPQPGMAYAQVITPGYQIQFEAAGQVYTFHTDIADRVVLCDAQGPDEIFLPP